MNSNSELNQILVKYLKQDPTAYSTLDDIPHFREYFINYIQVVWKTSKENLEMRYKRWCKALSEGDAWREVRQGAVYGLLYHCDLKQYQIAKLLNVSVRTIRRDLRYMQQIMYGR
ncbi:MAG: DeoR family transcriptional regulator [Nitrosarchaeum sp.]